MQKNIILLFGGASGEHEVSCVSAKYLESILLKANHKVYAVYITLDGEWHLQSSVPEEPQKYEKCLCSLTKRESIFLDSEKGSNPVDFAFPIIHGTTGEDGKLQGLLEFTGLAYAGAGVLSSALCMDKYFSKILFKDANIPQVPFIKIDRQEWQGSPEGIRQKIKDGFKYPVFIKPSNMGSSVGVSRVGEDGQLEGALTEAFLYDDQVLCEQGYSFREVEVSIIGNYPDYRVSSPGEIIPSHNFYSYEAKYIDQDGARLLIPAEVSPEQSARIQELAISAFRAVKGDGFARIDFFIDKQEQTLFLNEINTLPGFTPISMFARLWEASGLPAVDLLNQIIELGVEKYKQRKSLKTSRNL